MPDDFVEAIKSAIRRPLFAVAPLFFHGGITVIIGLLICSALGISLGILSPENLAREAGWIPASLVFLHALYVWVFLFLWVLRKAARTLWGLGSRNPAPPSELESH